MADRRGGQIEFRKNHGLGNDPRIFAWYLHERGLVGPEGRRLSTKGGGAL